MQLTSEIEQTAEPEAMQEPSIGSRTSDKSLLEPSIVVLIFLLSLGYLCLFRRVTTMEPDEGILLQGAERILSGQVLYRDFFSFYTPGSYYALALLFRLFGDSMVVARTALAFAGAILSSITYLLARRVCSRAFALTAAALTTVTTLPYRFLVLHNWDSTLLAVLAIYCAVRLLEDSDRKWAFALGSFASLTVLFEQSKGVGLCLGVTTGLLSVTLLQGRILKRAQLLAIATGLAWPVVITLVYFASQHAAHQMLADWVWPLQHYSRANHVSYGYQNWSNDTRHLLFGTGTVWERVVKMLAVSPCFWIPIVPLIALAVLAYWILQARCRTVPPARSGYYILIATSCTGLLLSVIGTRPDIIHFMYLQPLNCLVLAWVLTGNAFSHRSFKPAPLYVSAYVVIAFALFGVAPLMGILSARNELATRRGVVYTQVEDTAIKYVQAHVPAGEQILIYPYLPLYYYATGTFSPSPYDYFQPGMHTRQQAERIIADVGSRHIRVVLFETSFVEKIPHSWPATNLASIAQDPIADYIASNYRACRELRSPTSSRFQFMVRKDLTCP